MLFGRVGVGFTWGKVSFYADFIGGEGGFLVCAGSVLTRQYNRSTVNGKSEHLNLMAKPSHLDVCGSLWGGGYYPWGAGGCTS